MGGELSKRIQENVTRKPTTLYNEDRLKRKGEKVIFCICFCQENWTMVFFSFLKNGHAANCLLNISIYPHSAGLFSALVSRQQSVWRLITSQRVNEVPKHMHI